MTRSQRVGIVFPTRSSRMAIFSSKRSNSIGLVSVIAARLECFLSVAGHRVRRESDHGNASGRRMRLYPARRLPTIHGRQTHIHKNQIGRGRSGEIQAFLTILGNDNFLAPPYQAAREHITIHLVVFGEEDFWHRALIVEVCSTVKQEFSLFA
jgi:hypothetical protein